MAQKNPNITGAESILPTYYRDQYTLVLFMMDCSFADPACRNLSNYVKENMVFRS